MKLGELIEIKHGYAFSGEHIVEDDNGIVLVTPGNFRIGGGFKEEKCKFFDGEIPADYVLKEGDFIVTMTDLSKTIDTLGYSALVPKSKRIYLHNQRIGLVTFKSDECDRGYIYWLMRTREYQRSIANTSTGATVHHTSPKKIYDYDLEVPPLPIQHRIATILSRYDSLIENYQKQIKLLEEAAQRLYKEWFVDLRFPGHENTKIVDGLPEGWEKMKLCEFTGITDGTHDSPKQVEIGLPLVTGRCIVDGNIDFSQAYNISEEDVIKINKRSAVEDGDILLSNIGTIGKVCRISKSGNYAVKNMIIFKPHDAIHSCFLHRFLTDNNTQMDFLQQAAGTSQKFVSLSFIRNTLILRPSDTILNLFYNHSEKYFNYVKSLQSQLRLLAEARDRLLPKLMGGEIEV